jgi:hypothetical protein
MLRKRGQQWEGKKGRLFFSSRMKKQTSSQRERDRQRERVEIKNKRK